MKKLLTLCVAAMLLSATLSAQNQSDALPFIRIERDPAATAMAGAGSAMTEGIAYSAFRNAAVIPFFAGVLDAGVTYQNWAPDGVKSTNIAFGAGYKFAERFGISLSGVYQNGETYDVVRADGTPGKSFTPNDLLINAGIGFAFTDQLSLGASLRYASSTVGEDASYSSFGGDVMLLYRDIIPGLNATAGVRAIGTPIEDSVGESFSIPASAAIGASYGTIFAEKHALTCALDADYFFSGNLTIAGGLQYGFNDLVFARAGYHFGTENAVLPSYASVGLGVKWMGIRLDVAYLTANDAIGNSLAIGLGYSF